MVVVSIKKHSTRGQIVKTVLSWVSYRLAMREKAFNRKGVWIYGRAHAHIAALSHMRFSWSSYVFGSKCGLHCENPITRNHFHMNWHTILCSLMCMDWFLYLAGWGVERFWVAKGSPILLDWQKVERTQFLNSVPIHTLGLRTTITETHSYFRADTVSKEPRSLEREVGRMNEIKRPRRKWARESKDCCSGLIKWPTDKKKKKKIWVRAGKELRYT